MFWYNKGVDIRFSADLVSEVFATAIDDDDDSCIELLWQLEFYDTFETALIVNITHLYILPRVPLIIPLEMKGEGVCII